MSTRSSTALGLLGAAALVVGGGLTARRGWQQVEASLDRPQPVLQMARDAGPAPQRDGGSGGGSWRGDGGLFSLTLHLTNADGLPATEGTLIGSWRDKDIPLALDAGHVELSLPPGHGYLLRLGRDARWFLASGQQGARGHLEFSAPREHRLLGRVLTVGLAPSAARRITVTGGDGKVVCDTKSQESGEFTCSGLTEGRWEVGEFDETNFGLERRSVRIAASDGDVSVVLAARGRRQVRFDWGTDDGRPNPPEAAVSVGETRRQVRRREVREVASPEFLDGPSPSQLCAQVPGGIVSGSGEFRRQPHPPHTLFFSLSFSRSGSCDPLPGPSKPIDRADRSLTALPQAPTGNGPAECLLEVRGRPDDAGQPALVRTAASTAVEGQLAAEMVWPSGAVLLRSEAAGTFDAADGETYWRIEVGERRLWVKGGRGAACNLPPIQLMPLQMLAVRVIDRAGRPVARRAVSWRSLGEFGEHDVQLTTDADGRFSLTDVSRPGLLVLKQRDGSDGDSLPVAWATSAEEEAREIVLLDVTAGLSTR